MADHPVEHREHDAVEPPVSLSHIVRTLRAYQPAIILTLASVAIGYALIAIFYYLSASSQVLTTLPFRLDFAGATDGHFPNGTKFSSADIVGSPTLLKVYNESEIRRFVHPSDFTRAIFVLEANPAYERLAAEYQLRLADPKLSALDRERIQREFESKREGLSKNEFSINFLRTSSTANIPEVLVQQSLNRVLQEWAKHAINEKRILDYHLSVLSPEIMDDAILDQGDYIASIQILRSRINKVLDNIAQLRLLPGAELSRTSSDHISLDEIKLRLEDLNRFRLEPLVSQVRAGGLVSNPAGTIQFLETQLAYDQRWLRSTEQQAASLREALALYLMSNPAVSDKERAETSASAEKGKSATGVNGETFVPQLNESFIDRLVTLTNQSSDIQYRQKAADEYRTAATFIIPPKLAVEYDTQILAEMRGPTPPPRKVDPAVVRQQLTQTQQEVKTLLVKVNEIYKIVSRDLIPSTQVYTVTSVAVRRTERAVSLRRLLLIGIALILLALPLTIAFVGSPGTELEFAL